MNAPVRILQLVNILGFGGAEGQFTERVRTLDRRRFTPLVIVLKKTGTHLAGLRRAGIEPRELPLARSFAHPRTAAAVLELAAFLRRERIRLVHAQDFYTNLLAVPAARLAGVPVITSRLDLAHWHGPRRRQVLALATRLSDRVQVNALAIRRQLEEEEDVPSTRVRVVRNGLDLPRFDERAAAPLATPLPLPPGALAATIVANLHPIKGQEDAIAALSQLARKLPALHLVLVGDGDRRGLLVDRAAALGVGERVHFLGHRTDVPAILAASDLVLSTSHAEGLSNSIIEAMAARRPLIATAVGGSPELVDEGRTGLLVPPRSPGSLARALERLATDEGLRRDLGSGARAFVVRELSIDKMARDFARLYEEVLDERARRGQPAPVGDPVRATA